MNSLPVIFACLSLFATPPAVADVDSTSVVVVLPTEFDEAQHDLAAAGDALSDLLAILLPQNKRFRVADRQELPALLEEQKRAATETMDTAAAVRIGNLVHADYIISSAVTVNDEEVRLQVQLVEVHGARIACAAEESGALRQLDAMYQRAIQSLAKGLGVPRTALRPEEMDRSPQVSLHYMRGLAFYHEGLALRAQVEFLKVTALDPLHEDALVFSARCFRDSGEIEHARLAADRVLQANPKSRHRAEMEQIAVRNSPPPETAPASTP